MLSSTGSVTSTLAEYQIDDPAAANVRQRCVTAVRNDVDVAAACVLEGVRENWHLVEVPGFPSE
jgi:hypothetical protein